MDYIKSFKRLEKLHDADLGFYVLGTHSFMKSYIKDTLDSEFDYFAAALYDYQRYLKRYCKPSLHDNFIKKLKIDHNNTNKVRHNFEQLIPQEAETSTHNFIQFLKKTDIDPEKYKIIVNLLSNWKQRINKNEESAKLLQQDLLKAKEKIVSLEVKIGEVKNIAEQLELIKRERAVLDHKLKSTTEIIEKISSEKSALEDEKNKLLDSKGKTKALEDYIHYLSRFSLYTRTRADYEKSVLQLSTEQKNAIDTVSLKKDFLIKGSAGTGKSLVLLKALVKAKELNSISEVLTGRIILLTYSRTLKKYNSYISDLLKNHLEDENINTVDSFLLDKFTILFPDYKLDPYFKPNLPGEGAGKLTKTDLKTEIEDFILAGNIKREEYLKVGGIIRSGMKIKGLQLPDRTLVWNAFESYINELENKNIVNFPYLRYKLLNYLQNNPENRAIRDVQYMFIDEVQDMTPCSLAALKELTTGVVIMAGDNNQKLFAATSPYNRAGISLKNSTVSLTENFRNTNQIMHFANTFLQQNEPINKLDVIDSFREGPLPEVNLIKGSITESVVDQIKIYINDLGYEKHNIAIILNSTKDAVAKKLLKKLDSENIGYVDTTDNEFDFSKEGNILLTTLHSCKGLDFPVVIMCIPYLKEQKNFNDESNIAIMRNLFYVAFTRAMDNLNIFIKDKPKGILKEIVDSYEVVKSRFV